MAYLIAALGPLDVSLVARRQGHQKLGQLFRNGTVTLHVLVMLPGFVNRKPFLVVQTKDVVLGSRPVTELPFILSYKAEGAGRMVEPPCDCHGREPC